ncbi:hypothetical protein ACIQGZ_27490 [Streptomyces sp. NPDC092296]|uniref:hypothetical protein n=1 Tax=Streptomyces sp. NPDC092296 TaxID=3366012 RepID=UPI0038150AF5
MSLFRRSLKPFKVTITGMVTHTADVGSLREARSAILGACETALGTLPPGKALDAYSSDAGRLNLALSGGEADSSLADTGSWVFSFESIPLEITIKRR